MLVIVADDHPVNRKLLFELLTAEGHRVHECDDGAKALAALQAAEEPCVGLIDWQMPFLTGPEVCRAARAAAHAATQYLILVTVRDGSQDIVAGLEAGANDHIAKPFDSSELLARVKIGCQMVALQQSLRLRVAELESALAQVKELKGLLPICGYCKKIRDDQEYWQEVEDYIADHVEVSFSHGVCPDCFETKMRPQMEKLGLSPGEIDQVRPRGGPPPL